MESRKDYPQLLIVEDDPNDVAVAMRAFRRHKLDDKVEVIDGGARALDYLRAVGRGERPIPQVLFLDLKMANIDGLEVLREVRATRTTQHVPVVMISSSRMKADIEASYESGVNSFVIKRFDPDRPGEYLVDVARYWLHLNQGLP
jgi:two-component system response regulator